MASGRPTRTDSQILGDIGESTVSLIIKKFGWTADIIKSDYGEDIDCNIFIDNIRTNYHFRCQVKSSKKDSEYVREIANGDYSLSISSDTLRAWLISYFPVFIIIYEENSDTCYWCNPQEQVLKNPSKLEKETPLYMYPKKTSLIIHLKN